TDQLAKGDPANGRGVDDRNHLITVPPEDHRGDVLDGRLRFPGDKGREACGVEDPGHSKYPLLPPAGHVLGDVTHRVEGIADDGHLAPHTRTPSFSMIASATWLVPTALGSERVGFMSYVTLLPSRMTSAIARSRLSAAARSSR